MGNAGITEYLAGDHRGIDELFEQAQKRVRDGQAALAREPFEKFAARLGHIRLEEEVVFPLFEARTRIAGPAQVMRREHRLLEAHLEQARLCARERRPAALRRRRRVAFGALLGEHNNEGGADRLSEDRPGARRGAYSSFAAELERGVIGFAWMAETLFVELKRYVRFGVGRRGAAARAREPAVAPHFAAIAEAFYARLAEHEEARRVFSGPAQIERLKGSLCEWMQLLFTGP